MQMYSPSPFTLLSRDTILCVLEHLPSTKEDRRPLLHVLLRIRNLRTAVSKLPPGSYEELNENVFTSNPRFHQLGPQCKAFVLAARHETIHIQPVLSTSVDARHEPYVELYLDVGKFARRQETRDAYLGLLKHIDHEGRLRSHPKNYHDILAQALPELSDDDLDEMECYDLSCDPYCDPDARGAYWARPSTPT